MVVCASAKTIEVWAFEGPQEKHLVRWKATTKLVLAIAYLLTSAVVSRAQTGTPQTALAMEAGSTTKAATDTLPDAPQAAAPPQSSSATSPAVAEEHKQTKRILYIVPNFRAVSANEKLPPQSVKEKFTTAAQDSVDYSSFIFVGIQAGIAQSRKSTPEFRQGAAGYARYYWHTYADSVDENLWVEFIIPAALHQDSRFYTLGHGSFPKRLAYSFSRVAITRTDGGHETFNASEIVGAGASSGISNLYYPSQERTFTKVYQRWITNVAIDGGTFVFKEFWPDLNSRFFHQKD